MLKAGAYGELKALLLGADLDGLRESWPKFEPLGKLVLFKLLEAPRAAQLYLGLDFSERYFLFCGLPLAAIAPVLERLLPAERRLFVQLPQDFERRMASALLP